MKSKFLKLLTSLILISSLTSSLPAFATSNSSNLSNASNASSNAGKMEASVLDLVMNYQSGQMDPDGGVEEIVSYSKTTGMLYAVNGKKGVLDVISTKEISEDKKGKLENQIDVKALVEGYIKDTDLKDFKYGDMTSVSVSDKNKLIAVSIQDEAFDKEGIALFMDFEGKVKGASKVGVQPDMICFSPDESMVLTANEGEPREGYGEGKVDPEGSISLVALEGEKFTGTTLDFKEFDGKREDLVKNNVVLKKEAMPSKDLEPEFISVSEDNKFAYVTLQENNSVALVDLANKKVTHVLGLGFKDFSKDGNELDLRKDKKIELKKENVFGIYMPDAIASYKVGEETYLVTANEGDSREWGDYLNEVEKDDIVYFGKEDYDIDQAKDYIFGGRSFSIWSIKEDGIKQVYDSGSSMEKITSEKFPEFFNVSNDNLKLDSRSGKKGPEPEGLTLGKFNGKTLAFVALERIGGIMVYDITDPNKVNFLDYVNTRDFSEDVKGDVAPEGLVFIEGEKPALGVAYEVSGSVSLFNVNLK